MVRQYTREAALALGDNTRWWVTFNEPYAAPIRLCETLVGEPVHDAARRSPGWRRAGRRRAADPQPVPWHIRRREQRSGACARTRWWAQTRCPPRSLAGSLQGLMDWALTHTRTYERWRSREERAAVRRPLAPGGVDVTIAMLTDTRSESAALSQPYFIAGKAALVARKVPQLLPRTWQAAGSRWSEVHRGRSASYPASGAEPHVFRTPRTQSGRWTRARLMAF